MSQTTFYSQALYAAACTGDLDACARHMERGAEVNYVDPDWKQSPLHAATIAGHRNVVLFLLSHGANVSLANEGGETPHENLVSLIAVHKESPVLKYTLTKSEYEHRERQKQLATLLSKFLGPPKVHTVRLRVGTHSSSNHPCVIVSAAVDHPLKSACWFRCGQCEFEFRPTDLGADAVHALAPRECWEIDIKTASNLVSNCFNPNTMLSIKNLDIQQQNDNRGAQFCTEYDLVPGKLYRIRARIRSNQHTFKTVFSPWSDPIMHMKLPFALWLHHLGLDQVMTVFGNLGIHDKEDMYRMSRQELESNFRSCMDFSERRKLWGALQIAKKESRYCTAKESKKLVDSAVSTADPLYAFLEKHGLDIYFDAISVFCGSLGILVRAYDHQMELIEDIKEVVPEMKPPHRRVLWKALQRLKEETVQV
jgi:hypothetical protein